MEEVLREVGEEEEVIALTNKLLKEEEGEVATFEGMSQNLDQEWEEEEVKLLILRILFQKTEVEEVTFEAVEIEEEAED